MERIYEQARGLKSVLLVLSGFLVIDWTQAGVWHHCPVVPLEVQIEGDLIINVDDDANDGVDDNNGEKVAKKHCQVGV